MRSTYSFTIHFRTFKHKFEIQRALVELWAQSSCTESNVATAKNQVRSFIRNLDRCSAINESLDEYVLRNIIVEISKRYRIKENKLLGTPPNSFIDDRDIEEDIWDLVCSSFGSFARREDGIYCPCGTDNELVFVYRVHPTLVSAHSEFHRVVKYEHRGVVVHVEYNTAVLSNDALHHIVAHAIEKKLSQK